MKINFNTSKRDSKLIRAIAERGISMAAADGVDVGDKLSVVMDLTACHANGCPLRLEEMASADDANFGHDFYGITRYIDRSNGKLSGMFCPRFAAPQSTDGAK